MTEPTGVKELTAAQAPANLPPLPWSYTTNAPAGRHEGTGFVYLHSARGRRIGTLWGKPDEKLAMARYIADASARALNQTSLQPDIRAGQEGLPPLPWSYTTSALADQHEGAGFIFLIDAKGRKIGTVWGSRDEKVAAVQLIMDIGDAAVSASPVLEAVQ